MNEEQLAAVYKSCISKGSSDCDMGTATAPNDNKSSSAGALAEAGTTVDRAPGVPAGVESFSPKSRRSCIYFQCQNQ